MKTLSGNLICLNCQISILTMFSIGCMIIENNTLTKTNCNNRRCGLLPKRFRPYYCQL